MLLSYIGTYHNTFYQTTWVPPNVPDFSKYLGGTRDKPKNWVEISWALFTVELQQLLHSPLQLFCFYSKLENQWNKKHQTKNMHFSCFKSTVVSRVYNDQLKCWFCSSEGLKITSKLIFFPNWNTKIKLIPQKNIPQELAAHNENNCFVTFFHSIFPKPLCLILILGTPCLQ